MPIVSPRETFNIEGFSPALLSSVTGVLNQSELQIFHRVFAAAAAAGSLREVDFTRDPTTSFNAWPARIAQICIEEARLKSLPILAISVLSCCDEPIPSEMLPSDLPSAVLASAKVINSIAENFTCSGGTLSADELLVVKVQLLDRARHLHLADKTTITAVLPRLIDTIKSLINDSAPTDPVTTKLEYWVTHRAPLLKRSL